MHSGNKRKLYGILRQENIQKGKFFGVTKNMRILYKLLR